MVEVHTVHLGQPSPPPRPLSPFSEPELILNQMGAGDSRESEEGQKAD